MSTYGKKALSYWDYEAASAQDELARFNNTPHNLQEELLKKWFPEGMGCEKTGKGADGYYGSYTVAGYAKYGYGWRLLITDEAGYTTTLHPGTVRPDAAWRRNKNIEKLGI